MSETDCDTELLTIKVCCFLLMNTACVIKGGPRQDGLICIQGGTRESGHNVDAVGR